MELIKMRNRSEVVNAISIDVEDYFQVSAFEKHIPRSDWLHISCRVEQNLEKILALLQAHDVKATFFTLGWIAERFPHLVRRIADLGHELASHGYSHVRVTQQDRATFAEDIDRTRKLLEDISGCAIVGYRAASYSINRTNLWAHEEILKAGYNYSSSIYPIRHDLYGIPDGPRFAFRPIENADLLEIPVTTLEIGKRRIPCGGGGFFRLYPYLLSRWMIRRVNMREKQPAIFYFHPWEIDPDQPRVQNIPLRTRLRHYINLGRTERRLHQLLSDFKWANMSTVFLGHDAYLKDYPTIQLA